MLLIDLVSPSSTPSLSELQAAKSYIEGLGHKPVIRLEDRIQKYSKLVTKNSCAIPLIPKEIRAQQLIMALQNNESDIVWCTNGGYGSADILPILRLHKKIPSKKIFIGFSDITSISNFLIQNWGFETISAPMVGQIILGKVTSAAEKRISDLLFKNRSNLSYKLTPLSNHSDIKIDGILVGGCLSVLSSHFGTKDQIDWKDKILFLEDEGESGERLDRLFRQISDIIHESKISPKAILLGNFFDASKYYSQKSSGVRLAIQKFVVGFPSIPFFERRDFGHAKNMSPIILGRDATIINSTLLQTVSNDRRI